MQPRKVLSRVAMVLSLTVTTGVAASFFARSAEGRPVTETPDRTIHIVTSQPQTPEDLRDSGPFRGFDTNRYPGDSIMHVWRETDAYQWVGYYLPAPCHRDSSWAGTRASLEQMGWGTAVIYVGQQTWGRTTRPGRALGDQSSCRADLLSAARGTMDADDAIARADSEGFAAGTVIFLDIEYMNTVTRPMRDYYTAWTARVLEDARYRPGYYAHTVNAETIYNDVVGVFARAGSSERPAFWVAGGRDFSPDKWPEDVGLTFAAAWQGVLDVVQSVGGVSLPIDVSVGDLPSPSATMATMQ